MFEPLAHCVTILMWKQLRQIFSFNWLRMMVTWQVTPPTTTPPPCSLPPLPPSTLPPTETPPPWPQPPLPPCTLPPISGTVLTGKGSELLMSQSIMAEYVHVSMSRSIMTEYRSGTVKYPTSNCLTPKWGNFLIGFLIGAIKFLIISRQVGHRPNVGKFAGQCLEDRRKHLSVGNVLMKIISQQIPRNISILIVISCPRSDRLQFSGPNCFIWSAALLQTALNHYPMSDVGLSWGNDPKNGPEHIYRGSSKKFLAAFGGGVTMSFYCFCLMG